MDIGGSYSGKQKFSRAIDELLITIRNSASESQGSIPKRETIKLQSRLDTLADLYQHEERLGAIRYKLYFAQALIHYYNNEDKNAVKFLDKAEEIRGGPFELGEKLRSQLRTKDPQKVAHSAKHTNDVVQTIKQDAGRGIWVGLGLIVLSLIITIITFNSADAGETYFIFWGLGLWGLILFAKNLYIYVNPKAKLDNSRPESNEIPSSGPAIFTTMAGIIGVLFVGVIFLTAISPDLVSELNSSGSDSYGRDNYIREAADACESEGGNEAFCSCAATYMYDNYSTSKLQEIDEQSLADESYIAPEVEAAAQSCQYLL